jgi:hypothetical protein
MRWVNDQDTFERVVSEAQHCSGREEQGTAQGIRHLRFDSCELCTPQFFELLTRLMAWSSDNECHYLVSNPDPFDYFYRHFRKYPLLEIKSGDSADSFLTAMSEDPGESPADAVGINWREYVVVTATKKWCIKGIRDDTDNAGGHLWVAIDWGNKVIEAYPYAR